MEQTLNNERVEYTKTIENLNNTNKEKDEWNNSNLEKLHELYGKQIDKLQEEIDSLNKQLVTSREDVCRLTMEVHGVQSTLKNSNDNNNNSMDDTTNNSIAGSNSILSNNTNGIDDKGAPTNESIWVERISLYENKMVEAQDNERMMRHELIEANKALEKAVETNTNTIQKYTSSKKLIGELKMVRYIYIIVVVFLLFTSR